MGTYFNYPSGQMVHDKPEWQIRDGYLDQDNNTVYVYVQTSHNSGWFMYYHMYINVVRVYKDGTWDITRIAGVDGSGNNLYKDFSGSINIDLNNGCTQCYLAMRCSMYTDTGGASCTTSPTGDADKDPGWEIPGTRVDLKTVDPPQIGNQRNTNSYKGNSGISASTNSISFAFDLVGGDEPTETWYHMGDYWRVIPGAAKSFTATGLNPGTWYNMKFQAVNEAGNGNEVSLSVRTRYQTPTITAKLKQRKLEGFVISWTSDINLKQMWYKVDSGNWQVINVNSNYGEFEIPNLDPNTSYKLSIQGTSDDSHDALDSNVVVINSQTLDIGRISSFGNIIFSNDFNISINSPSGNKLVLRIWSSYGGFSFSTNINVVNGTNTINFSQSDLDKIYKTYPDSNNNTLHFQLTTKGRKDYQDSEKQKDMILTGIAKTVHTGINNKPRRVQVWVGDASQKPRRAVTWVKPLEKIKRTI